MDDVSKYDGMFLLWFVEEGIFNPKYHSWAGGRMEIHTYDSEYAISEIRFFTPRNEEWISLAREYDGKWVDKATLDEVSEALKNKFYIETED